MAPRVFSAVIALALLYVFAAPLSAQEMPAPVAPAASPEEACSELCGKLYNASVEDRDLCLEGCEQAATCTASCKERFEDGDKRDRCHYRCARAR